MQLFRFFKHFHSQVLILINVSFLLVLVHSKLTSTFKGFLFIYLKRPFYYFMFLWLIFVYYSYFPFVYHLLWKNSQKKTVLLISVYQNPLGGRKLDHFFLTFLGHFRSINWLVPHASFQDCFFPVLQSLNLHSSVYCFALL